jgi:hypothetical protein
MELLFGIFLKKGLIIFLFCCYGFKTLRRSTFKLLFNWVNKGIDLRDLFGRSLI